MRTIVTPTLVSNQQNKLVRSTFWDSQNKNKIVDWFQNFSKLELKMGQFGFNNSGLKPFEQEFRDHIGKTSLKIRELSLVIQDRGHYIDLTFTIY